MADSIKQIPFASQLPAGGTAGQLLAKIDAVNYNTQWIDSPVPVGNANSFAGFDALGLLESIPGWQRYDWDGANVDLVIEPDGNAGGFSSHLFNSHYRPLQNSPDEYWSQFGIGMYIDDTNTGFDLGTSGSFGSALSLYIQHNGTADVGQLALLNMNYNIGNGTDPISVNGLAYSFGFGIFNDGVTLTNQVQGYGFQPYFDTGVILQNSITAFYDFSNVLATGGVPGYTHINFGPNISQINNNANYTVLNASPTISNMAGNSSWQGVAFGGSVVFDAANTGGLQTFFANQTLSGQANFINGIGFGLNLNPLILNNNVNMFFDNNNIQTGSDIPFYGELNLSPTFHLGSSIDDYQGINLNPTFNGTFTDSLTFGYIGASGTASIPNVFGFQINTTSIISPNQKTALDVTGRSNFYNQFTTAEFPVFIATTGQNIGGQFEVALGSPITGGEFIFGTSGAWNMLFNDDMGVDVTGGLIGFTGSAAVGQISVALGKTVDTINLALYGCGLPPIAGDGGTVTNFHCLSTVGILPSGGNLNVTNLYGVRVWGAFDAIGATNSWGISVESALAENYLQKSLVIGGTSKAVTNSDIALEIQAEKTFVQGYLTDAQEGALTLVDGMEWYNTDQNEFRGVKAGAIVTFTTV